LRPLGLAAGLALVAMAQVTVAPLFPVGTANFEFVLVSLAMVLAFSGPRTLMGAMPFAAICLAFASNRSPALLILAYLPMLPLAGWLAESGPPMNRFLQVLSATMVTGAVSRSVLAAGAVSGGAELAVGPLITGILLPGLLLDMALLTVAYGPVRLLGWEPGEMTLQPGRY
jgi:hypothetical protein